MDTLNCPNCGAPIVDADSITEWLTCPHCDSKIKNPAFDSIRAEKAAEIKTEEERLSVQEEENAREQREKMEHEERERKIREEKEKQEEERRRRAAERAEFNRTMREAKARAKIERQRHKVEMKELEAKAHEADKKKGPGSIFRRGCLITILVLLAAIILLIILRGVSSCQKDNMTLEWPNAGLASLLPEPNGSNGRINQDTLETFSATIRRQSENDFRAYVEECQSAGFDIEAESLSNSYRAYSDEGYKVEVSYSSSNKELSIQLDSPIELEAAVQWPTTGPATLVPKPNVSSGKIVIDSHDEFMAYFGNFDKDAFNAYINECINAGFDANYSRNDDFYTADNRNGTTIKISYTGFNIIRIDISSSSFDDSQSGE